MRTILTLVFLASSILSALPARAHEYHELQRLDPNLRGFLIKVLEDARTDGMFQGEFDDGQSTAKELNMLLKTLSAEDSVWLKTKAYPEFVHPTIGALPEGIVMQFFYELAGFAHEYEAHGGEDYANDPTAKTDFDRLDELSSDWWGTK